MLRFIAFPLPLFIAIATSMTMLAVACSNSLSDYSEQMNPIFQEHMDEYALVDDALDDNLDAMANCLSTPRCNLVDLQDDHEDLITAFDRYERIAVVHMDKWVLELKPPDEALEFHELTLELFQLRHNAIVKWKLSAEELFEYPRVVFNQRYKDDIESIGEQLARADRLLIRILAEARELGSVKIDRGE